MGGQGVREERLKSARLLESNIVDGVFFAGRKATVLLLVTVELAAEKLGLRQHYN